MLTPHSGEWDDVGVPHNYNEFKQVLAEIQATQYIHIKDN